MQMNNMQYLLDELIRLEIIREQRKNKPLEINEKARLTQDIGALEHEIRNLLEAA